MSASGPTLFESDYYAWTRQQAAALRALAADGGAPGLDLSNLADEIDELGRREREAVRSDVRRILDHLLMLEHSRAVDAWLSWQYAVAAARDQLEGRLTPSLRRDLEAVLPQLFQQASRLAAIGLSAGEPPDPDEDLPASCPYSLADVLRPGWYPENRYLAAAGGRVYEHE